MADAFIMKSGSGIDLDLITTEAEHILVGKTGIDREGEPLPGTMPERGGMQEATSINLWQNPEDSKTRLFFRMRGGHYGGKSWSEDPDAEAEIYADQSLVASKIGLTSAKLMAGQTVLGVPGTATSDANAGKSHILKGYSSYTNGQKVDGDVTVQSILSFSAAVYSSTAISFSWRNPVKGAYSGVIIVGKTGSYPSSITDGTRYYKGAGNNTSANGTSTATVSSFASGNTYYFRAFSYAVKDGAEWVHSTSYTATATTTKGQIVLTSSGSWTVPTGVRSIDVFCVGGGSSGIAGGTRAAGAGGGSGYTATRKNISVTPGAVYAAGIGAGGAPNSSGYGYNNPGGDTYLGDLLSAGGGTSYWNGAGSVYSERGRDGGSGGGASGRNYADGTDGRPGGADGGRSAYQYSGYGQGATTRAFGESGNTLYAGAGGGGGGFYYDPISESNLPRASGAGGAGGGGNGGYGHSTRNGSNGTAGTGGGGGGASAASTSDKLGGYGGSGLIIIRWGY